MLLDSLTFDNSFVKNLPGDENPSNTIRQVTGSCYSKVFPSCVRRPELIAYSPKAAQLLDLDDTSCTSELFTEVFSGNDILPGMFPFAMCYGGHQFGNWAGQLGDGRAINLGEVVNREGNRWMLQLKGAGPTPYSRRADGLAVLRSSIREFLCSEAMYHLGVPTTRALSLILTGEQVLRDMFYDGHPKNEPGAVVCRISPSFTRFGNFEIFSFRKEKDVLRKLVDYTIKTDFPHLGEPSPQTYLDWFAEICERTAELMVHWLRVGFVHGVMNTDNMSILGLTIDYGPYGWLEGYDPQWTPNTTDAHGKRYAFGNQPSIGLWNLTQLANSLMTIINDADALQSTLDSSYRQVFIPAWEKMMAAKLGLSAYDEKLVNELIHILKLTETDMTIFFRQLALIKPGAIGSELKEIPPALLKAYYTPDKIDSDYLSRLSNWLTAYKEKSSEDQLSGIEREKSMNRVNPKYVLRNYLAQQAIEQAETGDYSRVHELFELLKNPYDEQPSQEKFYKRRPEWARHKPGSATLS